MSINYEQFSKLKDYSGWHGSWLLKEDNISEIKPITAVSGEDEYNNLGLNKILKNNVIFLGLNLGNISGVRFEPAYDYSFIKSHMTKNYTFSNARGHFHKKYATILEEESINGAYFTDFVKFFEVDGQLLPVGIANSDSNQIEVNEEIARTQAKGLYQELSIISSPENTIFILLHSKINNDFVQQAIRNYFPNARFLYLPHYSYRFFDKMEGGLEGVKKRFLEAFTNNQFS